MLFRMFACSSVADFGQLVANLEHVWLAGRAKARRVPVGSGSTVPGRRRSCGSMPCGVGEGVSSRKAGSGTLELRIPKGVSKSGDSGIRGATVQIFMKKLRKTDCSDDERRSTSEAAAPSASTASGGEGVHGRRVGVRPGRRPAAAGRTLLALQKEATPAVRPGGRAVLEMGMKFREMVELETRRSELEALVKQ